MANGRWEKNLPLLPVGSTVTGTSLILKYDVLWLKYFPAAKVSNIFLILASFFINQKNYEVKVGQKVIAVWHFIGSFSKIKPTDFIHNLCNLERGLNDTKKEDTHRKAWASTQRIKRYWHNSLEKNRSEEKRGGIIEQLKEDEWQFITFSLIF